MQQFQRGVNEMIHEKAIIDKEVILGEGAEIGPYSVIEKGVQLGKGVKISPFVHLKSNTFIGDNTFIGTGAVIGEMPQMSGQRENLGKIHIGKNNIIREYVTINSSSSPEKSTSMGDGNFLMAFSHIAHDCKLGNNIVICNGTMLAGHVEIQDKAFISADVGVQQFIRIGALTMIGGLSRVTQDVPPFMMVVGGSRVRGLNLVGMKRHSFTKDDIKAIKKAYSFLYRQDLSIKTALSKLETIDSEKVKKIIVFIIASKKGICSAHKSNLIEKIFLDYPYLLRTRVSGYHLYLKTKKDIYAKRMKIRD